MVNARPPRQLRRQTPARRPGHRRTTARGRRLSWKARGILTAVAVVVGALAWAVLARALAPASNTSATRFDAIIVLGSPADSDGNPTPKQLARVSEGVHEYERGVAPRLIFSGGAVRNHFAEAQVMERAAEARGIPPSAIFVETEARDTIQNACYATRIMKTHGWRSAEVISSAAHLPRAGMIFSHMPLEWRMDAAPPLAPKTVFDQDVNILIETLKTVHYLIYSSWVERCEP